MKANIVGITSDKLDLRYRQEGQDVTGLILREIRLTRCSSREA